MINIHDMNIKKMQLKNGVIVLVYDSRLLKRGIFTSCELKIRIIFMHNLASATLRRKVLSLKQSFIY